MYSTGIDAFTVDWHGANGLFVPPIFLITRILKYMKQCNAVGTLIVPCWQSASFWPMLCPGGDGFIDQVKGYIFYLLRKNYIHLEKVRKPILAMWI